MHQCQCQCQWNIYIAPIVEGRIWGAGVWVTRRDIGRGKKMRLKTGLESSKTVRWAFFFPTRGKARRPSVESMTAGTDRLYRWQRTEVFVETGCQRCAWTAEAIATATVEHQHAAPDKSHKLAFPSSYSAVLRALFACLPHSLELTTFRSFLLISKNNFPETP